MAAQVGVTIHLCPNHGKLADYSVWRYRKKYSNQILRFFPAKKAGKNAFYAKAANLL